MTEEITFDHSGLAFGGTLYLPEGGDPCPALTVLHAASGGERDYHVYQHLAERLPAMGVGVLLYDRRGAGESEGVFETADFADLAGDGAAAVQYLLSRAEIDTGRVGIYGISQGGWIAPMVAAALPEVAFQVIVSGCAVTPAEQMDYAAAYSLREADLADDVVRRALRLRAVVNAYFRGTSGREAMIAELRPHTHEPWYALSGIPMPESIPEDVRESKWFYEMDHDPMHVWRSVRCPTLFLHAEDDRWVPVDESMRRYKLVTRHLPEVRFERIPGSDHFMCEIGGESERVSSAYLSVLEDWLRRRLDPHLE